MAVPAASSELSPVSAVSMATSESGCSSNSPCEAEIVASLCGPLRQGDVTSAAPSNGAFASIPAAPASWQDADALLQAQAALANDVDDPEELQLALQALERESPPTGGAISEATAAVRAELQLRLEALRADAAALIETLLELAARPPPILSVPAALAAAQPLRGPPAPGWHLVRPFKAAEAVEETSFAAPEVTTFISGDEEHIAALETALELATSLGMDTSIAEERATSCRALLSIRVTWGNVVRCCLLPVGVSFASLLHEVTCRCGLAAQDGVKAVGGSSAVKLSWRDGSEMIYMRDQASWEACLHRCGLYDRPGRIELRLEVPFVITGTRVPSPCTAGCGMPAKPSAAVMRPKAISDRSCGRGPVQRPSHRCMGGVPVAAPSRRSQMRGHPPSTGFGTSSFHLRGHSAAASRSRAT
jgi:hypothetical protein